MSKTGVYRSNLDGNEGKNPLIRDGIARSKREAEALSPDFIHVDEKDLADFLIFAHELSERITYYNLENEADGNWRNFFENSDPIQVAHISKTYPDHIRADYNLALDGFLDKTLETLEKQVDQEQVLLDNIYAERFEKLLDIYAEMLKSIYTWHKGLSNGSPLKSSIYSIAKAKLSFPLQQLMQLELAQQQFELTQQQLKITQQHLKSYGAIAKTFGLEMDAEPPNISSLLNELKDLSSASQDVRDELVRDVRNELDGIFRPLFQVYSQIITQLAPQALHDSLYGNQTLQPHIALYVAFWQILKLAQTDLNTMTRRHLDFFYRDVLRLSEQPATPDKANIILELEKSQEDYKLERHRKLGAGTDATGVDLLYTLDEDIVVNNAQVAELKGIFLQTQTNEQTAYYHQGREILDLHISPIANSFDGQGSKFPKELPLKAWQPFGDKSRPTTRLGLAIASNLLLLGEGDRIVSFTFTIQFPLSLKPSLTDEVLPDNLKKDTHLEFSGEADWIKGEIKEILLKKKKADQQSDSTTQLSVSQSNSPKSSQSQNDYYALTVKALLPIDADPVVPYHQNLSGGNLTTSYPVARLSFCHQDSQQDNTVPANTGASAYHYLHEATVQAINLAVEVKGIRNLLIQNDLSVLDAAKPFQPFGFQPKIGSNFYIGSQEVFQKKLTKLHISFNLENDPPEFVDPPEFIEPENTTQRRKWEEIYGAYQGIDLKFDPGRLSIQALKKRQWQPKTNDIEKYLFLENPAPESECKYGFELGESVLTNLAFHTLVENPLNTVPLEPWSYQSQYGFLKLQLKAYDFRHAIYSKVITRQSSAVTALEIKNEKDKDENPITKVLPKAVEGAYYKRPDGSIFESTKENPAKVPDDIPLLPEEPYTPAIQSLQLNYWATATQDDSQLFHLHPFDGVAALPNKQWQEHPIKLLPHFEHEGELLIGLQNLEPLTALSLLLQVAPETADTDLTKTPVSWHYLVDNSWKKLEDHLIVQDKSNGLIHSGIVKLSIPADISKTKTTILNPALHWIKAAVAKDSGAIAHIVNIHTQAAEVTFADAGNDPNHLATPLPEKSITEFIDPPPEIKAIHQPYPSFNGQVKEQSSHFYTRVSERLRHKGRAITIFDYEHLILERFPEIYKVRCINHVAMAEDKTLHEIAPGHVTIAVVPALSQRRTVKGKDLEPRVNINVLTEIQQYLKTFSSPWATIQVINPRYEIIRVEFSVQLKPAFQPNFEFYRRELEQNIISFLSPWAVTGADGENEIHFGGKIYRSSILKFVEDQPYVDYVIYFGLYKDNSRDDQASVSAKTAHSILVPAPFDDPEKGHKIAPIDPPLLSYTGEFSVNNDLGYNPLSRLIIDE